MKMQPVALVVIAKNEDLYLSEWVAYHLKLGFDRIFIYQNNWRTPLTHPQVTKFEFDYNKRQQLLAYKNFTLHQWHGFGWAMFMDVDEFLVLKQHKTVGDFCNDMQKYPAIGIPWVFFGDSGLEPPLDDYSVLKRFTKCKPSPDTLGKPIVQMGSDVEMHVHHVKNRKMYTPEGVRYPTNSGFSPQPMTGIAQVNHYFCKTYAEHLCKCYRGDVLNVNKKHVELFYHHNGNEVTNTQARDFLYPPAQDN